MRIKKEADEHVAKICATLIYQRYPDIINNNDFIIPVPLHPLRVLKRGFNQATLIAKHLSKISKIPLNTKTLKRIKNTKYQKNKTYEERQNNVQGAFISKEVINKKILLVDDVITTGATLTECSKSLKTAGAERVNFITIASTS